MPAIGAERAVLDCVETMSGKATLLLAAFFSLLELGERAGSDGFDVGRRWRRRYLHRQFSICPCPWSSSRTRSPGPRKVGVSYFAVPTAPSALVRGIQERTDGR